MFTSNHGIHSKRIAANLVFAKTSDVRVSSGAPQPYKVLDMSTRDLATSEVKCATPHVPPQVHVFIWDASKKSVIRLHECTCAHPKCTCPPEAPNLMEDNPIRPSEIEFSLAERFVRSHLHPLP
jgi:hypothetical protein